MEKENISQQLNPEYQEQFQKQADIINAREQAIFDQAQENYERRLENPTADRLKISRPLAKPIVAAEVTGLDIAHQEALRVNILAQKAKSSRCRESAQKIATDILGSKEFGLKTKEELDRRELLFRYAPDAAELALSADDDGAWKALKKACKKSGSIAKIRSGDLYKALGELMDDVLDTFIKANDQESLRKIQANNPFMKGEGSIREYRTTTRNASSRQKTYRSRH